MRGHDVVELFGVSETSSFGSFPHRPEVRVSDGVRLVSGHFEMRTRVRPGSLGPGRPTAAARVP
jgi:hypothetical protein